jgi:hypothetical protein
LAVLLQVTFKIHNSYKFFTLGEVQPWGRRKNTMQHLVNVKEDPLLKFDPKPEAALIESAME